MSQDDPEEAFPPYYLGPPPTQPPQLPVQPYPPQPYPPQPYGPGFLAAYPPSQPMYWHPAPPDRRVSNRAWSVATQLLLVAIIVIDVMWIHAVMRQRNVVRRFVDGDLSVSGIDVEHADNYASNVSGAYALCFIATGIVFITWLWRMRRDADYFCPELHRWGRGWAIGGWFVPFMSFVVPYRVVKDTYRGFQAPPGTRFWDGPVPALIPVWWIAFLVSTVSVRVAQFQDPNTADEFSGYATVQTVIACVEIVAAIVAIVLVEVLRRANVRQWQVITQPPAPA